MDTRKNTVLQATCYTVITQHEQRTGEPPTGVQFNKYMSLLAHGHGERAALLSLPHCWYRWGDEVVRVLMPPQLAWDHTDPPQTRVSWTGDEPGLTADDRAFTKIALVINQLIDKYSDDSALLSMITDVYSYAPFPFQRTYRELRNTYLDIMGSKVPVDQIQERLVSRSLAAALARFPKREFPGFANELPRLKCLMEHLVSAGMDGILLAREASEHFWFGFCYQLRLHPRANENIPHSTIDYWRSCLPDHMNHFENSFHSLVLDAGEQIPSLRESSSFENLFRRAEEREQEANEILLEFEKDIGDLEKYLSTMRDMRLSTPG